MKNRSVFFACLIVLALTLPSLAQEDKLGKVSFPTSCDPKVQAQFERGVAMLHSFWYNAGEKIFSDVLAQDPSCAIATWGIADAFNVQSTRRPVLRPRVRRRHKQRLTRAAKLVLRPSASATTSKRSPPTTRIGPIAMKATAKKSRAKAYEALAARYPDDDEHKSFTRFI